jgi:hypothetical protein
MEPGRTSRGASWSLLPLRSASTSLTPAGFCRVSCRRIRCSSFRRLPTARDSHSMWTVPCPVLAVEVEMDRQAGAVETQRRVQPVRTCVTLLVDEGVEDLPQPFGGRPLRRILRQAGPQRVGHIGIEWPFRYVTGAEKPPPWGRRSPPR